ncbi:hypothetical protein GF327_05235 [Candidatus Woesearchaeota archaeon]|nr:hypothetical protein [Candidatus Woesearchaeota archaeon]
MFDFFKKPKKGQYAKLKCPRCSIHMRKLKREDVVIDVCRKCNGMWLDDKEIDKLIRISAKENRSKKKSEREKNE